MFAFPDVKTITSKFDIQIVFKIERPRNSSIGMLC